MIHLKNILDCSLNQREKSQSYHVGKMLLNLHYTPFFLHLFENQDILYPSITFRQKK